MNIFIPFLNKVKSWIAIFLNKIKTWNNIFFEKHYKKATEIFLLLFFTVAFRQYYIDFFDNFIVIPILSKFNNNILYKISSIAFFIISIVFVVRQIIAMSIFNLKIIDWFLIGTIYNYVEMKSNKYYTYTLIFESVPISYSDLLIILLITYYSLGCVKLISYLIKKNKSENKRHTISFESDQPEKDPSFDLSILGYKDHAKRIAQKINSYDSKESLSIGIAAKWGSGKSTLMHFIENELLQNNKYHIVWLKSWNYKNTDKLLNDFFKTLDKNISNELFGLTSFFNNYKSNLIKLENQFLKTSVFEHMYNEPINDDYKKLNNKLGDINKKVVVFIDDLDRLEKHEIVEVLKLIRQTGSFNNFIYVSSYDKSYIKNALIEINSHNHEMYIEKIFQVEFTLPTIDTKKYVELFEEYFLSKIPLSKRESYVASLKSNNKFIYELDFCITTTRDAKRFANQIFFDTSNDLWDYIDIFEFIQIAAIKYRYPELYDEIQYEFHKLKVKKASDINTLTSKLKLLEKIVPPYKEQLTNILTKLFKGRGQEVKSISNIYHFNRYFTFRLSNEENFINEVRDIFNQDSNTIRSLLSQDKLNYNTIQILLDILKEYETRSSDEYRKFLSTYFILGSHIEYNSMDLDLRNLFRVKLYQFLNMLTENEEQNLFDFLMKHDKTPYSFSINMIQYLFDYSVKNKESEAGIIIILKRVFIKILNSILNYADGRYWKESIELIRLIRKNIEFESNNYQELEINSRWFKGEVLEGNFGQINKILDQLPSYIRTQTTRYIKEHEILDSIFYDYDGLRKFYKVGDVNSLHKTYENINSEKFNPVYLVNQEVFQRAERNDHFFREIFTIKQNQHITIIPESPYWRFGFMYSKSEDFPTKNEDRHLADYPVIHIGVGDFDSNNKWINPKKLYYRNYNEKVETGLEILNYHYAGKPIDIRIDWNIVGFSFTINIDESIYSYNIPHRGFKYYKIFAWCDYEPFTIKLEFDKSLNEDIFDQI
ncbi:MAG: KAP family P-loop NTPase fold protein [Cytophaga sp.]|uniref:KAP family P-loop NTPase fold protein n=1 Tax=Cytophaga sp. TaxID=29535 RepID=UPI003F7EBCB0